jgi:hypothetical protein
MSNHKASWTAERRAKYSEVAKARWADPETRKQMVAGMQNITPEQRKKISDSLKELWQDPEWRQQQSLSRSTAAKARWADPDKRAALMAARKPKKRKVYK